MYTKKYSLKKIKKSAAGFCASDLKLIAAATMLVDHVGAGIIRFLPACQDTESVTYAIYWIMRIIGRFSFPLFCFMIVEGFIHTHSVKRYALRLFVFAVLAELPFDMGLRHSFMDWSYQNVIFTLFIAVMALWGYRYFNKNGCRLIPEKFIKSIYLVLPGLYFAWRTQRYLVKSINLNRYLLFAIAYICFEIILIYAMNRYYSHAGNESAILLCGDVIILAAAMCTADLCKTDYSSAGILCITLMYIYKSDYRQRMMAGCVVLTALSNPVELASFVMVPVAASYNGTPGLRLKYFFYIFYPAHLLILYAIAKLAGLA